MGALVAAVLAVAALGLWPAPAQGTPVAQAAFVRALHADFRQGVTADPAHIAQWYNKACAGGEQLACLHKTWHLDRRVRSSRYTSEVFTLACDQMDPVACLVAGWQRAQSRVGGPLSRDTRRLRLAANMLWRSCSLGLASGCTWLARVLEAAQDPDLAHLGEPNPLRKQACDGGDGDGCAALGIALLESADRQLRQTEGRKLLELGCLLDSAVGCRLFADRLLSDTGVVPWALVRRTYRRGCKLGDARACHREAVLHRYGHGGVRDEPGALADIRRLCRQGVGRACGDDLLQRAQPDAMTAPDEDVLAGRAHVTRRPAKLSREYRGSLGAAYVAGPLLAPFTVGTGLLAPVVVHAANGQGTRAASTLGGMIGFPLLGALVFGLAAQSANSWNSAEWALLGAGAGYVGWAIYDVSFRAGEPASTPAVAEPPRAPELRAGVFGWRP